jgi:predicted Zn-dependent protease with MMP-like domain
MLRLTRKAFDRIVEDAIASLPEEFAEWIDEVPIIVEDRPSRADAEAVRDPDDDAGDDLGPLGLYVGHGLEEGRHSGDLPPRIMIYREPLMETCSSREQIEEEIRKTLLHELGHHAGMDEDQLDALGYGPPESENDEIEFDVDDSDGDRSP